MGLGTIETPLAMAPLSGAADGVGVTEGMDMDMDMSPDADGVPVERLATIAAASLGETVVVLANELVMPESEFMPEADELELDDEEPLPLPLLLLLPLLRMRVENWST